MLAALLWLAVLLGVEAYAPITIPPRDAYPQVISHRGACGYVPEHSLQAYQLAMDLMTDYVETDLVLTKDGVFVAMHDMTLDNTTNIADFPQWADRHTTRVVDGKNMTGFFASDFLASELAQVRLRQRLYQRNTLYNDMFHIPQLQEIIETMQANYNKTHRTVGLYIEIKHPSYSRDMGYDIEEMLLKQLDTAGYHVYKSDKEVPNDMLQVNPIIYECFDSKSLQIMRTLSALPQILLLEKQSSSFWTLENMKAIAQYADGIGPEKSFLETSSYPEAYDTVQMIYSAGLRIHPWTFRADQDIGVKFKNDFDSEETYFYCCLGMDAVFTEFPDRARETIDYMRNLSHPASLRGHRAASPSCPIDCNAAR